MSRNDAGEDEKQRRSGSASSEKKAHDEKTREQKSREQWNEGNETGNGLSRTVDDLEEDIIEEREREGATGNVSERADVRPIGSESDDVPD
ncbi:hypothetical protein [Lolliginicoccus suaedae]|uniref:hypothetical protein n=1 Tax=Lolliginicoccus suaedae TaxID=2605429 RepID=UPI0011EF8854|nr:hypothetical protein [Lolliginicoccus suaedae]